MVKIKMKVRSEGKPRPKPLPMVVIKIGGRLANNPVLLSDFAREAAKLSRGRRFAIVHGGGKEVSELSEKLLGKPAVFKDGVRQTSAEEMDIVEMVLNGRVNKRLVRLFQAVKLQAVGLSGADGAVFRGEALPSDPPTRTGRVALASTKLLRLLSSGGYVPVISSTTMDGRGEGVNINADEAALELAVVLKANALIYLSDIPGVLKDDAVITCLDAQRARAEIESGVITGGMIPKVESALGALVRGVKKVVIGEYAAPGALAAILAQKQGTSIVR